MKNEILKFTAVCLSALLSLSVFAKEIGKCETLFDFSEKPVEYAPPSWREGLPQWPYHNFIIPADKRDWRKYDRLIIELYNDTPNTDGISAFIGSDKGRVQLGLLSKKFNLPYDNFARWTIELADWPKTANPADIGRVHIFQTRPASTKLRIRRIMLVEKGAEPPPIDAETLQYIERQNEKARLAELKERQRRIGAIRETFRKSGQKDSGFWTAAATSMEKIRPRDCETLVPAEKFAVRLARNEHESFQVVVIPSKSDLKDVSVSVSGLKSAAGDVFPSGSIDCDITGYVNVTGRVPYKVSENVPSTNAVGYTRIVRKTELGWWPDPILNFLDKVDVQKDDVQSFWIRVNAGENQPAGIYNGTLKIAATLENGEKVSKTCPLSVRVNDFTIPRGSPLPLAITFIPNPTTQYEGPEGLALASALRKSKDSPVNVWKAHEATWGDFLADYFITFDSLYHRGKDYPKFDILMKLKKEGRLGRFNLGYWSYPKDLSAEAKEEWRKSTVARIRKPYEKAKELGILDKAYIYGCDEIAPEFFENIKWAAGELKKEFPDVPISTTAYDDNFGIGTALSQIDWFTPVTTKYDVKKAEISRKAGHQVWWYFACGITAPLANMFVECTGIEPRVFFGAQTVRMRPDGYLYYQTSIWNSWKPIANGPFTDWDPRSWTTYHGDGSWTCAGKDGKPLPTQRLENFRDGLEDYAYAKILEKKLEKNPDAEWAKEAKRLLEVPQDVMVDLKNYTLDPAKIYAWRDKMADLIETAK